MPKKKPIVKRLDKLFEDIIPEEAAAQPIPPSHNAVMGEVGSPTVEVPDHPSTRPVDAIQRAAQNELALSLAFQTGQNKWATLQVIDETAPRTWSQEDQLLVKQVTDQLSLALENARLFQETQSRAEELSVLNEMGRELSTKLEVAAIAEVVYRYTSRLMDTRNFFIALYDEKTEEKSYPLAFEDGQRVQLSPRRLGNRGFSDYIIRTKKAIFAPADVLGHMKALGIEFVPLHNDDAPPQCWLGVPMLIGERVMGLISVQNVQRAYVYDEHDRDILATIAGQAAIAIENARLFQEAQRRAQETATLAEVGREISVTLDLGTVLTRIATYAKDLFQAESSAVYLPETTGVGWRAIAVVGADAEEIKNDPIQTGRGILGNIALSKAGKIVNDASSTPEAVTVKGTIDRPFEHILGVPILSLDQVTGLMAVWRTGQGLEFSPAELDFLTSLARQAAIAIQNARLFNEITTSQGQLSEALQIARLGYFEIDLKNRTVQLTVELYSLLGTTLEKEGGYQLPLESVMRKFIIEEDIPIMTAAIGQATSAPEENPEIEVEVRFRTSDGRVIWVRSIFKLERDLQGQPNKVIGSLQDITERKINELTQAAITQISDAALTASRMEDLIKTVHNVVGTLMSAKNFYIALYDADADLMTFPYYVDEYDAPMPPQKLGRGLTSYVIRTGQPLRTTPEIYAELEEAGEVIGGGTRGVDWLGVPLRSEAGIRGVMAVQSYNPSIRITERHKEILTILGVQVTVAIERLQAGEALRKSDARLRLILETAIDAFISMDSRGTIIEWNPQATQIFGWPREEAVGRTLADLIIPEIHRDAHKRGLEHYLVTGEGPVLNKRIEITGLHRDGNIFPVELTITSVPTAGGLTFSAFIRDISERKRSEEALQRRNTYLAVSSEIGRLVTSTLELNTIFTRTVSLVSERFGFYYAAIYTIEESGFNAVLREATGAAGEKMKAQKYMVTVGSQTIVGKVAETGESRLIDDVSVEPLYQPNPLLLDTQSEAVVPLRIGSRIVGVIDIQSTQTHAFTRDDLSVLQSLADQVAVSIENAHSYELSQQAIRELREVDQIKSQFLANMSHELRTPLNSIIGFSRVILKGIDGPVTDMQQQDLTAIYNSGQHLLGLINDVLDLARIEAGKMELNFEEVHLSEMVTSVMSTAKGLVKEKPIQLLQRVPADMPAVRGDTMRVRQVLLNLISNASKFTDEGSITVEALVQKGPTGKMEALINVTDTGPGISSEDQKKLFQAFSQVDGSATRKSGGSGLGLSICANLVQLQGGRIGVHSEAGKGSTFYFTIPLFHQPVEEIPAGKKVILSIDDDPQVISLYERYLSPRGYHVVPLTDPTKAKERISELKPYAVTLDVMMPNKDGWSVLADLKSDPVTRGYPVVICSIMEQTDKGFSLGAADYLVKPILQEELVHALDRLNKNGAIQDVLVIDDDPNDLRLIEKILNEHGQYKPILVQGGRKGWEAINAKTPHAIIIDIFMPEMDGFTILEKLRENPRLRDIPVLVVSGGGLTNEQEQQLSDFGQRLITKASLNEGELIESIENALKRIGP